MSPAAGGAYSSRRLQRKGVASNCLRIGKECRRGHGCHHRAIEQRTTRQNSSAQKIHRSSEAIFFRVPEICHDEARLATSDLSPTFSHRHLAGRGPVAIDKLALKLLWG